MCTEGDKSLVIVIPRSWQDETPRRLTPPRENETAGSAERKNKTQHLSNDKDKDNCHLSAHLKKV